MVQSLCEEWSHCVDLHQSEVVELWGRELMECD